MNNTATSDAEGRTVLAFDGDCGFCQAAVRHIQLRANPAQRRSPGRCFHQS